MSERERWIVYPLLFFALGAALRDKLTHSIESKDIRCQSLQIVDQQNPNLVLAELSASRSGTLASETPVSFLNVGTLLSESLSIQDQENPRQTLVYMGSGKIPNYQPGELPRRMGVIQLKDSADSLISEMRADQLHGNRLVCKQIIVTDPENRKPHVQIGTVAVPAIALNDEEAPVSHQGVIVLNNQYLGLKAVPRSFQRDSKAGEQQ